MKLIFTNQYSELLLLVNGLALLLFYAARKKKSQRAMKFGNYKTLKKVAGESFINPSKVILAIKMLAMTLLIIGISNPVLQSEEPSTNSDYVLAIDTSSSMLTSDLGESRLSSAKSVSREFIDEVGNSTNIGVLSFSGQINNQTGLEGDKSKSKNFISNLEVGNYAGTAIGEAIYSSTTILLNSQENKTVILITDGVNNQGKSVNESIEYAVDQDTTVNTIGIGSGANRTDSRPDNSSEVVYPNLDSRQLKTIAERTGGNYTAVSSEEELQNALLDFNTSKVRTDFSNEILLLALLLFLGEWALGTTRYDILP